MRIGELAERTGVSARSLRHYEAQGLITAARCPNDYREYGEDAVELVRRIRWLLAAGLPTAAIREVLPCTHADPLRVDPCAEATVTMHAQLARIDAAMEDLASSRALLADALATSGEPVGGQAGEQVATGPLGSRS
jgi:DNA-binding transcriptional MerR regulator